MKFKKWFSATAASILLAVSLSTATFAEEQRTIADESMYDLLVDRYFNGDMSNDYDIDVKDLTKYAGGDFAGLLAKKDFIAQMGFTLVSIGSIFDANDYAGKHIKSYTTIEEHFGNEQLLKEVIAQYRKSNMGIVVDFPLSSVASTHEWIAANEQWVAEQKQGVVEWDLTNEALQQQLIEALEQFVQNYEVSGIRLTNLHNADEQFLNELIAAAKKIRPQIYIISNEESRANFDADYYSESNNIYRNIFKTVDQSSERLTALIEASDRPVQIMIDELSTNRFTYDVTEEGMFPPTRMKIALATSLLLPGLPVVQYGSELVVNGIAGKDAHQLYNFKTDTEMIEYIKNIQKLRNESATLRAGEWKLLKNDNGFITLKRKSEDEAWIVVINNTSKTNNVQVPINEVGANKELRGMFDNEIIRENKNAEYSIILDREMVEVYQIIEKRGINISYIIALALVFITYTAFIFTMMKRSKKRRAENN